MRLQACTRWGRSLRLFTPLWCSGIRAWAQTNEQKKELLNVR